jgi:transposase
MSRATRYPQEIRDRVVRMVFEHEPEDPSQWATIRSVSSKFGMSAETLRSWVRKVERDQGRRPALTTSEREQLKALERENHELQRANEILKTASACFAAELDRRLTR